MSSPFGKTRANGKDLVAAITAWGMKAYHELVISVNLANNRLDDGGEKLSNMRGTTHDSLFHGSNALAWVVQKD